MLDINFVELRQGFLSYLPFGATIGLIMLAQLIFILSVWQFAGGAADVRAVPIVTGSEVTNAEALGQVIYTKYVYLFQAAGMILLVAMIGAIVLTLRHRDGVKRQNIGQQVARTREEAVELKDVKPGQGL